MSNMENTNERVEVFNNNGSFVGSWLILNKKIELNLLEKSKIIIKVKDNLFLNNLYFCYVGKYVGRITQISKESDEIYSWTIEIGVDMFDYRVENQENYISDFGVYLGNLINEYQNLGFINYFVSKDISAHSSGYIIANQVDNFSEIASQIFRLYNIKIDVINIDKVEIKAVPINLIFLSFDDREIVKYEVNFSLELPTLVEVYGESEIYRFHLCKDGQVRSPSEIENYNVLPSPLSEENIQPLPITKNEVIFDDEATLENAKAKAEEIMLAGESNEIEIEMLQSSDYINDGLEFRKTYNIDEMLNSIVFFYMPIGNQIKPITSRITKIEQENDSNVLKLTLGGSRRRIDYPRLVKNLKRKAVI